jgi:hypothetical protein
MPEQQLDLLEFAAGLSVQFRAGSSQIVRRQIRAPDGRAGAAHGV